METMRIKACRICGNKKLTKIGTLGLIAISTFMDTPTKAKGYPLELVYCGKCTLLQLAHNTPRHLLYKDYWYQSHINPIIIEDLKTIAKRVKGPVHIDIGGNDGTLLKYSQAKVKICVDPSNIQPGKFTWINNYWENVTVTLASTITAIACLYDLPDPNVFLENIVRHLQYNGVFIAQLMTLEPMIENNDLGNICHEHVEYYSYKSLVRLYEQNGLEIFKVEKNGMNGGSYRIFARHYNKGSIAFAEKEYTVKELKAFFKRIEENKKKMKQFLIKNKDKYILGYGASTKANTILQYYGITDAFLKGILEVNEKKVGKYTVNTHIPIWDEREISQADYVWVFPYGFMKYFKKKEKKFKGKWITTIPEFKIL